MSGMDLAIVAILLLGALGVGYVGGFDEGSREALRELDDQEEEFEDMGMMRTRAEIRALPELPDWTSR